MRNPWIYEFGSHFMPIPTLKKRPLSEEVLSQHPLVIIPIGVTASGKSTWAQQMQKKYSTLNMAIIPTPEASVRNQAEWLSALKAARHHAVMILDGKNLEDAQLREDLQTLKGLGILDVVIQYFPPESLFVLLTRNKGIGGEQIRHELQMIHSQAHYLDLLESAGYADA